MSIDWADCDCPLNRPMPSNKPVDPEPVSARVTSNAAQLRVSCACGQELLITAASPLIRCVCGRSWQLHASATLVGTRADQPDGETGPA